MADQEAIDTPLANRFFCHKCKEEINNVILPDYTCPTCNCGFIETIENAPEQIELENDSDVEFEPSVQIINEILNGISYPDGRRGTRNRMSARGNRGRQTVPIENIIQEFLVASVFSGNMGSNTFGVGTGRGGGPVLLLGNPGDYAWGREGLDAIVTQLLNQIDTTGPPPLAKDKINEIPIVNVTKAQADTNLQCSVCWEDFKVDEQVRRLPCEHVYHENCIIPWLELHGTCPICRKTLTDDGRAEDPDNTNTNGVAHTFDNLTTFLRFGEPSSFSSSSASSSSTSSNNSSANSSSSSTSRPDFNMDLEYD